jgi:cytochrome c
LVARLYLELPEVKRLDTAEREPGKNFDMSDTMTMTKVVGAFCGALLVFMLTAWAGSVIYGSYAGLHDERPQAFVIEVPEAGGAAEEAAPEIPIEERLAAGDPARGERVFGKCAACHKLDGTDGVGPHLNGVVNRPKASIAAFAGYSDAIKAVASEAWTPENLYLFVENPKGYMPGTAMNFAGLPDSEDRANLVAYLASTQP